MQRTITSIEVVKNSGLKISDEGLRQPGRKRKVTSKRTETIHADPESSFLNKFNKLRAFLIMSTGAGAFLDALRTDKSLDCVKQGREEDLKKSIQHFAGSRIEMQGIKIKYDEGRIERVTIIGTYRNDQGDVATITSPAITMTGSYEYAERLERETLAVIEEAHSYLAGNYSEIVEEEPDFEDEPEEGEGEGSNEEEAEGVKGAKLKKVA